MTLSIAATLILVYTPYVALAVLVFLFNQAIGDYQAIVRDLYVALERKLK